MSNFCDLNRNIKHIGEVSTSRKDGSPTGAKILTSTNENTGDVRYTIAGKFAQMDDKNDINFVDYTRKKDIEFDEFLDKKDAEFCGFVSNVGVSQSVASAIITNQRLMSTAHPLFADDREGVDFFTISRASNFDTTFMVTSAFESNKKRVILATAKTDMVKEYGNVKVINRLQDKNSLTDVINANSDIDDTGERTLYCDMNAAFYAKISKDALSKLDRIVIIPEGTSVFNYDTSTLDLILAFAVNAKANGVKNVDIGLWSSIDIQEMIKTGSDLSKMPGRGVGFFVFDFAEIAKSVREKGNQGFVISASIDSGSIRDSAMTSGAFVKSKSYDVNKKSLVFFGSYTRPDVNVSKTNQIEILKKLDAIVDLSKYNIIFKGHPSETTVNDWIDANPNKSSSSYFHSFPFETWIVLGAGEHKYNYDGVDYVLPLPAEPSEIYAVFSTSLYTESVEKIKLLLGYNDISDVGGALTLTSTAHESAEPSRTLYNEWKSLTGATSPFEMTYNFVNKG